MFRIILLLISFSILPVFVNSQNSRKERRDKKVKDQGENCLYLPIANGAGISNICEKPDRSEWQLIFEDQFNDTSLNETKWMSGYGWCDYAGDALYQRENIVFNEGKMTLLMDPENKISKGIAYLPDDFDLHLYGKTKVPNKREWECTGAAIRSFQKFFFGKFEIRCKFDNNKNYFPAFWLFSGPAYSEIDIFEFKGQWGGVSNNMHHNSKNDGTPNNSCGERIDPLLPWRWSKDWHIYTCEWDPFKIKLFIDGKLVRIVYRFIREGDRKPIHDYQEYVVNNPLILQNKAFPTRPMHLIANITADDGKGGEIKRGGMHVDYIRAWSKHSKYDNLHLDNDQGVYLNDDHKYFPIQSPISDIVHYSKEDEISEFIDGQGEDFNHDGKDELVAVRNFDGTLFIYSIAEDQGKYSFNEKGRFFTGDSLKWSGVTTGDIDGDGKKEIIGLIQNKGILVWEVNYIRGDQKYKLNEKLAFPLGQAFDGKIGIECGDFNLDGNDEIAFIQEDSLLTILNYSSSQHGLGVMDTLNIKSLGSNFIDLTVGDFDGNEFVDIALVSNSNGNLNIIGFNDFNHPYVKTIWELPSALSDWTSISAGQYAGDSHDQIVIHRNLDNLLTVVDFKEDIKSLGYTYSCTYPVALGSGFYNGTCENIVALNSFGEIELKQLNQKCLNQYHELPSIETISKQNRNQMVWEKLIEMDLTQKFRFIRY